MDELLKSYARTRRAEGPARFELSARTRERLHAEVVRQGGKQPGETFSWLDSFALGLKRIGLAWGVVALVLVTGVLKWTFTPSDKGTGALALFADGAAPGRPANANDTMNDRLRAFELTPGRRLAATQPEASAAPAKATGLGIRGEGLDPIAPGQPGILSPGKRADTEVALGEALSERRFNFDLASNAPRQPALAPPKPGPAPPSALTVTASSADRSEPQPGLGRLLTQAATSRGPTEEKEVLITRKLSEIDATSRSRGLALNKAESAAKSFGAAEPELQSPAAALESEHAGALGDVPGLAKDQVTTLSSSQTRAEQAGVNFQPNDSSQATPSAVSVAPVTATANLAGGGGGGIGGGGQGVGADRDGYRGGAIAEFANATATEEALHFRQVDTRVHLRRNLNSPPPPNVLNDFELKREGDNVVVRDQDGSVYPGNVMLIIQESAGGTTDLAKAAPNQVVELKHEGAQVRQPQPVTPAPGPAARARFSDNLAVQNESAEAASSVNNALANSNQAFSFRASGTNRTLNQVVVFTGNYQPEGNSQAGNRDYFTKASQQTGRTQNRAAPGNNNKQNLSQSNALSNGRIEGRAQVGPNNLKIEAVQVAP